MLGVSAKSPSSPTQEIGACIFLERAHMPYPKTQAIRLARRERAEEVQRRAQLAPLEDRIKNAGKKELAKLVKRLGQEVVDAALAQK